jgi:hypothetical protein
MYEQESKFIILSL